MVINQLRYDPLRSHSVLDNLVGNGHPPATAPRLLRESGK
jgi:hypothetical protein